MIIWFVLFALLGEPCISSVPVRFDSTELGRQIEEYVLKTYVSRIDSSRLVPESFGLALLDSTMWHDTTYYAVAFTYANHGYGNRTTESIVATISTCGNTLCDCGHSYYGAVDEGRFVACDSALLLELTSVYSALGMFSSGYSLKQVRPLAGKTVYGHYLTESGSASGRFVDNNYIKLVPSMFGLPDTVAVLVTHHQFDWKTDEQVDTRRELEVFKLDLANDSSYRVPIQPADSADWFRWYRLIQQPVRFENRLGDTLPRENKKRRDGE